MPFSAVRRFFNFVVRCCLWAGGLWGAYFGIDLGLGGFEIGRESGDWFAGISFIAAGTAVVSSAVFFILQARKF